VNLAGRDNLSANAPLCKDSRVRLHCNTPLSQLTLVLALDTPCLYAGCVSFESLRNVNITYLETSVGDSDIAVLWSSDIE